MLFVLSQFPSFLFPGVVLAAPRQVRSWACPARETERPPEALRTSPLTEDIPVFCNFRSTSRLSTARDRQARDRRRKLLRLVSEGHVMTQVIGLERHRDLRIYWVLRLVIDEVGGHNERTGTVGVILNDRVLPGH